MKEKFGLIIILSSIFLLAWLWIESIISFKYIISIGYPIFKITAFIILLSISLAIILGIFINSFRQSNIKLLNTQVNKKDGFSLLEILLVITIIGVFSSLIVPVVNSLNSMVHLKGTKQKMEIIATKVKQYYRTHRAFPSPAIPQLITVNSVTKTNSSIPIDNNALELEQKYRLDEWGQYFHFIICYVANPTTGANERPNYYNSLNPLLLKISGSSSDTNVIRVNGQTVAGVIVSGGPNQQIDSFSTTLAGGNYLTTTFPQATYTQGDDIYYPINVSMEAKDLVLEDLKKLNDNLAILNRSYAGTDNNKKQIPEASCPPEGMIVSASANTFSHTISSSPVFDTSQFVTYVPGTVSDHWTITFTGAKSFTVTGTTTGSLPSGNIDTYYQPQHGTSRYFEIPSSAWGSGWDGSFLSLTFNTVAGIYPNKCEVSFDYIAGGYYTGTYVGCASSPINSVIDRICTYFNINCTTDPWENKYVWGTSNIQLDLSGPWPYTVTPTFSCSNTDRRFHKLFSKGPDGDTDSDPTNTKSLDDIVY